MAHADGTLTLLINDVDLLDVGAAYGMRFTVDDMTGPTGAALVLATTDVPGGAGAIVTSERGGYASRDWTARIHVEADTVEDVARAFRIIRELAGGGRNVRLRTDLDVAYEATGRLTADVEDWTELGIYSGVLELTFRLDDPLWYALEPTTRVIRAGERVRLPLGSAPCEPTVTIFGPTAAPTEIVYRDARGVEVSRLTLDVGLGVAEWVRVRAYDAEIVIVSAGVAGSVTDGYDLLSPTADFPVFDPQDALGDDAIANGRLWPTLEVADLAGTGTAVVSYVNAVA